LRTRCEDALTTVFSGSTPETVIARAPIAINRASRPVPIRREIGAAATVSTPGRVGIEFFDPAARMGVLASFDVGGAAMGARIMMLFNERQVALYTAEGKPVRSEQGLEHGPLSLTRDGNAIVLSFEGPAVVVPDASAYLSIEHALASGRLDTRMEVNIRFEIGGGEFEFDRILSPNGSGGTAPAGAAAFGRATGAACLDDVVSPLSGFARAGMSFTGLGPQRFNSRKMLWASFDNGASPFSLEIRETLTGESPPNQTARMLLPDGWRTCKLRDLTIESASIEEPPRRITASLARSDGSSFDLEGQVECFIPLSRPGPEQSRIYTSLGFASFRSRNYRGAGMFEYSRQAESVLTALNDGEDSDAD
jgi:hypothetical protein